MSQQEMVDLENRDPNNINDHLAVSLSLSLSRSLSLSLIFCQNTVFTLNILAVMLHQTPL